MNYAGAAGHTCMSTTALVMGAGGGEFRCKLLATPLGVAFCSQHKSAPPKGGALLPTKQLDTILRQHKYVKRKLGQIAKKFLPFNAVYGKIQITNLSDKGATLSLK